MSLGGRCVRAARELVHPGGREPVQGEARQVIRGYVGDGAHHRVPGRNLLLAMIAHRIEEHLEELVRRPAGAERVEQRPTPTRPWPRSGSTACSTARHRPSRDRAAQGLPPDAVVGDRRRGASSRGALRAWTGMRYEPSFCAIVIASLRSSASFTRSDTVAREELPGSTPRGCCASTRGGSGPTGRPPATATRTSPITWY